MPVDYNQMVMDAYADIGRSGVGSATNQIDPEGLAYWTNQAQENNWSPDQFNNIFGGSVSNYFQENPDDRYTVYVADHLVQDAYGDIGREGIGSRGDQIDQQGYDYWRDALISGDTNVNDFDRVFSSAVQNELANGTNTPVNQYVANYLRSTPRQPTTGPRPVTGGTTPISPPAGGSQPTGQGTPYLHSPVSVGGSDGSRMSVGGQYSSPLIQALRQQSNQAYSNNNGVQRYANAQPNSGGLTPTDPNRGSSIFSPTVSTPTPYNMATDPRAIAVNNMYKELLGRDAEEAGLSGWVRGDKTLDEIRAGILASPEYLARNQGTQTQPVFGNDNQNGNA